MLINRLLLLFTTLLIPITIFPNVLPTPTTVDNDISSNKISLTSSNSLSALLEANSHASIINVNENNDDDNGKDDDEDDNGKGAPPFTPPDFITNTNNTSFDFNGNNSKFSSNANIIAQDIGIYSETDIKDYPLSDLPSEEIKAVFMFLDSGNITKVLLHILVDDLKKIKNKLSEVEFNNILNRISISNQNEIKERINKN